MIVARGGHVEHLEVREGAGPVGGVAVGRRRDAHPGQLAGRAVVGEARRAGRLRERAAAVGRARAARAVGVAIAVERRQLAAAGEGEKQDQDGAPHRRINTSACAGAARGRRCGDGNA